MQREGEISVMREPTKIGADNVPIFTDDDAFDGVGIFIHLSTDYSKFTGRLHKHEFAELSYVLSGEAEHEAEGKIYRVRRGDVIAIRRDTAHTFRLTGGGEPFVAYDLMLSEELFRGSSDELGDMYSALFYPRSDAAANLHLDGAGYTAMGDIFHRIYTEYTEKKRGYAEIIKAYSVELIVKLFRYLEGSDGDLSSKQRALAGDIAALLKESFRSHPSLDELAARMHFSKDYLGRVFKEYTGSSIGSYLQKLRLDRACDLLRRTDAPIDEVAKLSGFGDAKALYTAFKKSMGTTPGKYRSEK
jgi:AraC-like DNA-binding protein/mannose-6-phosphate isomerase-like protein (cupin superfamily)